MLSRVVLQRRRVVLAAVLGLLAALVVSGLLTARASGASTCERFTAASAARAKIVTGAGDRVVVIGDSWSAGLGLKQPGQSWPSRLPGEVHVAGFSGSGFSASASDCGRSVSFSSRAPRALADGADLLVVEGGLNDYDRTDAAITRGFARLMESAAAYRTVVVGPATAPSRAGQVPRVDRLLRSLCEQYGVAYVSTADLDLPYLPDRLHLTPAGHRAFGDAVAQRIAALTTAG